MAKKDIVKKAVKNQGIGIKPPNAKGFPEMPRVISDNDLLNQKRKVLALKNVGQIGIKPPNAKGFPEMPRVISDSAAAKIGSQAPTSDTEEGITLAPNRSLSQMVRNFVTASPVKVAGQKMYEGFKNYGQKVASAVRRNHSRKTGRGRDASSLASSTPLLGRQKPNPPKIFGA